MRIGVIFILGLNFLTAQTNCEYYKQVGQLKKYEACSFLENQKQNYYQFDERQISILQEALKIDSTYAEAYYEISVPYVKSGNFLEWKKYQDLATFYDPESYLGKEGGLKYKFFADYKGAISDIDSAANLYGDPGYMHNGTYHLFMVKALAYRGLGELKKAIQVAKDYLDSEYYSDGLFDYLHLGVMYRENKEYDKAEQALLKQIELNNIADVQYHLGELYKEMGNLEEAKKHFQTALNFYENGYYMLDPYNELDDQIYREDIM